MPEGEVVKTPPNLGFMGLGEGEAPYFRVLAQLCVASSPQAMWGELGTPELSHLPCKEPAGLQELDIAQGHRDSCLEALPLS